MICVFCAQQFSSVFQLPFIQWKEEHAIAHYKQHSAPAELWSFSPADGNHLNLRVGPHLDAAATGHALASGLQDAHYSCQLLTSRARAHHTLWFEACKRAWLKPSKRVFSIQTNLVLKLQMGKSSRNEEMFHCQYEYISWQSGRKYQKSWALNDRLQEIASRWLRKYKVRMRCDGKWKHVANFGRLFSFVMSLSILWIIAIFIDTATNPCLLILEDVFICVKIVGFKCSLWMFRLFRIEKEAQVRFQLGWYVRQPVRHDVPYFGITHVWRVGGMHVHNWSRGFGIAMDPKKLIAQRGHATLQMGQVTFLRLRDGRGWAFDAKPTSSSWGWLSFASGSEKMILCSPVTSMSAPLTSPGRPSIFASRFPTEPVATPDPVGLLGRNLVGWVGLGLGSCFGSWGFCGMMEDVRIGTAIANMRDGSNSKEATGETRGQKLEALGNKVRFIVRFENRTAPYSKCKSLKMHRQIFTKKGLQAIPRKERNFNCIPLKDCPSGAAEFARCQDKQEHWTFAPECASTDHWRWLGSTCLLAAGLIWLRW